MNIDVSTLKSKNGYRKGRERGNEGTVKRHAKTVIENECKYGTID